MCMQHIDMLEQKVADLQCELDVSQDRNHNRSRPDIDHVENRLKRAEIELAKYERVKEALHTEKAKVISFRVCRYLSVHSGTARC